MKKTLILTLLLIGCKATEVVYVPTIHTEEVTIHDTIVEVRIPEHYAERETRDTISELSNPFAYSRAAVTAGTLTHTLGIHPSATVKERVVYTETIVRDTIRYPVEVPVYIERELRGWRLWVFYAGVLAIVIASVAIFQRLKN